MRIISLLTDGFGGFGGISVYNRDIFGAINSHSKITTISAFPRRVPEAIQTLPSKLSYNSDASEGTIRYMVSLAKNAFIGERPLLIHCAHLNLVPLAILLKSRWKVPVLLAIYGIDAWQPTNRKITNWAINAVDRVYSISSFTRDRFSAWSGFPVDKIDLLPNAVHLEHYGMGVPNPTVIEKFGLKKRRVILTLVGSSHRKEAKALTK